MLRSGWEATMSRYIPDKDALYRVGPLDMEQVREIEVLLIEKALVPVDVNHFTELLVDLGDCVIHSHAGCDFDYSKAERLIRNALEIGGDDG